jgi:hypothetical protein
MSFLTALLVTLAVEVPLYVAALVALHLARPGPAVLLGVAVNAVTHPLLWWYLAPRPTLGRVVVAEVLVWAVEAGLLWLALGRRPGNLAVLAVVSAGANAASILAGALISAAA